ncbi:hypothetical protein DFP73DRAFT_561535 [Morchella snyderi]|nr:hypothetical protein DFP73DRAFT_561535 [Morchella snyderi]
MALPAQTAVMSYGSILGLVFSLFIASAQADITNDCRLLDSDGSPVGHPSMYSGSRNETDGWVGEPNTRGSMTIVTTCLVTLGLCVWTSIHVNVQIDQLPFYRLRHKVATSLKALIFPNLVVEEAQNEWAEMIRLYEALANVLKRAIGMAEKAEDPDYPFSKEVCFFVVMHGFVRPQGRGRCGHCRGQDQRKLTKAKDQLAKAEAELVKAELPMFIITPEEFFNAYARNPDVFRKMIKEREKDILDKGNASNIAKLIIMAQVTKLVLQMLGRKAMGLSVAVLELHIFVRILIAGLLYCYWWYKQLDVNEPMELDIGDPYWAPDPMWSYYPEVALRPTGTEAGDLFMEILNPWSKGGFRVQVGQLWEIFLQAFKPSRRFHPKDKKRPESDPGAKDRAEDAATRWNDAVKQINETRKKEGEFPPAGCLEIHPRPTPNETVPTVGEEHPDARPGCKPFTPTIATRANFGSKRRAMWFYIAYAGLHATVWEAAYFPSWYEKWIWRGACIAVAVVPVIALGLEHLAALREMILLKGDPGRNSDTEEKGREGGVGQGRGWAKVQEQRLRTILDGLLELVYLLASLALLGESFSILRAEDTRTYIIKSWTAELPLGR